MEENEIKKIMDKAGQSPRSIQYMLATIRIVFNYAINNGLFYGSNPAAGRSVKRPTTDNRRTRFLTKEETVALLLAILPIHHSQIYQVPSDHIWPFG
jgi:site-specific recombinase XerD